MEKSEKNILWLNEISMQDVPLVGGKNASLGEMYVNLSSEGVNLPNGFALTSSFYWKFIKANGLDKILENTFKGLNPENIKSIQETGKKSRTAIAKGVFPEDLKKEVLGAYGKLEEIYGKNPDVAVRTSGVAEDMPNASFAGQFETYLNIRGGEALLDATRKCIISTFTDRAIYYRAENKIGQLEFALSVGVIKMVRSDVGSSGVMFSCDTETGFSDIVLINASYGLGENVVKGRVEPDQYYVFETTLKKNFKPIIEKRLGAKLVKMVYTKDPKKPTKNISATQKERQNFVLNDEEILTLARWSIIIEDHYQKPMDTEWAKDGQTQKLYIVQARPETVQSKKNLNILEEYILDKSKSKKVLLTGLSVGNRIGQGKANRIMEARDINKFKKGEVLVTDMTDPDWVPAMKLASAIVTDSGGRTAHAAIVSRELGIPCVVGTGNATKIIKTGKAITVDCSEGEIGRVFEGIIPFEIKKTDVSNTPETKTKITMNLGEPGQAFALSFIPNDGVGLAREEFIIANDIKIHPMALINYKKLKPVLRKKIDKLTLGYSDKVQFYVDKLAEGIAKIGAAFYPKQVIVRFSDFKTNEYRSLVGGELYEPEEENPMMGFRGASRYYDEKFQPAFKLECKAIKKVREEFGLDNVQVMVPFCRTVEEGKKVIGIIENNGLKRESGLKIYVMCEIPSNVILAEQFLEIFDGFSVGSNDLTQLTLGLDRDNGQISHIGDERNEAIIEMLKRIIKVCKEKGKYVGICGEAPSNYPEFAEFLVEQGIESMSLNPHVVLKTRLIVVEKEKALGNGARH
jgi:pyruvate,water dikinase